jgi:hypothetical protein
MEAGTSLEVAAGVKWRQRRHLLKSRYNGGGHTAQRSSSPCVRARARAREFGKHTWAEAAGGRRRAARRSGTGGAGGAASAGQFAELGAAEFAHPKKSVIFQAPSCRQHYSGTSRWPDLCSLGRGATTRMPGDIVDRGAS